ncbi:isochorismatase family cysteine hydrolase [Endozoicomonas sp. SCSIO W0465]|uniref:isochorismatase family cysteine hydrolase n=1 Tax=Endozoicomonas sp. SCSIO W0465 TaxID=2918516 RepID=UPI00207536FC|nr:isochorismatase family cysteine hydrolase [Endozoicomonas sp. SCSIO W0465]USE34333.1 cysteine hydrolase [Endozoicomonas sp. SCSIO W0465]
MNKILSRDLPPASGHSALLIIDIQNFSCTPEGGNFKGKSSNDMESYEYYFQQLSSTVLPNIQRLQKACRQARIEVLFTVIESLTLDGRDRGLDYKITGFNVPRGSKDAQVIEIVKPVSDEIVIPKTSSSVFISTNIDYLLRNMECRHLIIAGVLTDQCVESAVRDACDLNYLVTLVSDACTTFTETRHHYSLKAVNGYCRQRTTVEIIHEISEHNEPDEHGRC